MDDNTLAAIFIGLVTTGVAVLGFFFSGLGN